MNSNWRSHSLCYNALNPRNALAPLPPALFLERIISPQLTTN
ncbi:hypothetical protein ACF3DV_03285 [Chlorogloeopsis fritschii PCC 9212]|nr:hypothetical protein [Chlorogloeopsis fritschii]